MRKHLQGLALFIPASALFLLCGALPAFAQSASCSAAPIPVCGSQTVGANDVQIKPMAVPTSIAAIATQDAYLKTVTVTNTTSGALTFTLADRQASPIAVLAAVSVGANTTYVIVFPSPYWCPSGFTALASGSGLNFYAGWRQ
jgi:hypothetical protein